MYVCALQIGSLLCIEYQRRVKRSVGQVFGAGKKRISQFARSLSDRLGLLRALNMCVEVCKANKANAIRHRSCR